MRISDWSSDVCSSDLTIRPGTTHEALAQLKLAFRSDEMCARFPEIQWGVTAGNASQITDGAAALLLVSERAAKRLGLRPRARFVGFDVIADRSEEHTSELQSLMRISYAVFCLKKKKKPQ